MTNLRIFMTNLQGLGLVLAGMKFILSYVFTYELHEFMNLTVHLHLLDSNKKNTVNTHVQVNLFFFSYNSCFFNLFIGLMLHCTLI